MNSFSFLIRIAEYVKELLRVDEDEKKDVIVQVDNFIEYVKSSDHDTLLSQFDFLRSELARFVGESRSRTEKEIIKKYGMDSWLI